MLQKSFFNQPDTFQFLFENHPDGICIVNVDGHILYGNASLIAMFGYTLKELLHITLDQLLNSSSLSSISIINRKDQSELAVQQKKGSSVYVRITNIPLISDGQEMGNFIRFEEIPQQVEQSKEIDDIQEMLSLILNKSQNIISSISAKGLFTYISPTVKAQLGYTPEEVIGKPAASFNHPDTNLEFLKHRDSLFINQDTVRFIGQVRHKNGEYRWYETTAEYVRNEFREIIQTVCVGRDITDHIEAKEKIAHLAYHDSVTDLPNRRLFKNRVNQLLEEAYNDNYRLLLLDLDGFKYVNDTFGHDTGDFLLIEVGKRLTNVVRDKGLVARWGGDEFTVLLTKIENQLDLDSLIREINNVISEPIFIEDDTLFISASIGVSLFYKDGDTVEELLKNADAAMYRAKKKMKMK